MRAFLLFAALAVLAAFAATHPAAASAIINNGVIQLGVNDEGHLNVDGGTPSSGTATTGVGVRYMPTNAEATAPGCYCEGWGVAYGGTHGGGADVSVGGVNNLACVAFSSTPSTAKSQVCMDQLTVTHDYHPSANPDLYEVSVTIHNEGATLASNVLYRRVMDWDVEPTAFNEYVSIHAGMPPASNLLYSSDNGFANPNPLTPRSSLSIVGPPMNPDFNDNGPADHGAFFEFGFGDLAPGASRTFKIFYGAAPNETSALSDLASVNAEVWSLGQPQTDPVNGTPNTFMFAFGDVGGNKSCDAYTKYGQGTVGIVTTPLGTLTMQDTGVLSTNGTLFVDTNASTYAGSFVSAEALRVRVHLFGCEARGFSQAAHVQSEAASPVAFEATGIASSSITTCYGSVGSSNVATLSFQNGELLNLTDKPAVNTHLFIGPFTVILNEQIPEPNGLTVNAVHLIVPSAADVILGHSYSAIEPCGHKPPTCSFGVTVDAIRANLTDSCHVGPKIPDPCSITDPLGGRISPCDPPCTPPSRSCVGDPCRTLITCDLPPVDCDTVPELCTVPPTCTLSGTTLVCDEGPVCVEGPRGPICIRVHLDCTVDPSSIALPLALANVVNCNVTEDLLNP